jgi:hypothetical protein
MCSFELRASGGVRRTSPQALDTAPRAAVLLCFAILVAGSLFPLPAWGQGAVGFTQQKPFVTGLIPVVGRGGAVGGVSIDAQGVVARSDVETSSRLRDARLRALAEIDSDLNQASTMRKVSLRGLIAALEERRRAGLPITDDLQNLAGLTRVEFVLVYPEHNDIVLAGPAEGWQVDQQGHVVGRTSGQPVLQLDDLLVALRTASQQPKTGELITCSIDPTEEGTRRFTRLVHSRNLQVNEQAVARLEEAAGPQQITLTGVAPGTHFAHVLVAADFLMKRLGMNLERSPVEGFPSYMEMLQASSAPAPKNAMPRWWMAPRYEPLLRDADGLAWQLRGPGIETLSEEGFLGRGGKVVAARAKGHSLAKEWADTMTEKYEALALKVPVFAELRNCMDLSVVAALIVKEDLPGRAGCDLDLLLDEKWIAVAEYHVPKTLDSRVSLIRKDRQWIVSVSGGVEIDSWSVLEQVEVQTKLAGVRAKATAARPKNWWWD